MPTLCSSGMATLACTFLLTASCASEAQRLPLQPTEEPGTTAPDTSADISSHRWSTRLRVGDGVSLENEYGDLRVRQSGDSGLYYAAMVQKLDGEDRDAEFGTLRRPDNLQIEVKVPSDWNGRVDASARVPAGSVLELRTTSGLIEVRTGDNDVLAVSPAGRFSIRTGGRIEARGETGDMLIIVFGTEYGDDGAGHIETIRGNVELWLQPHANLTLHASAGGGIDIDTGEAEVLIDNADESATLSFGDGDAELRVNTTHGTLVVRTLPVEQ